MTDDEKLPKPSQDEQARKPGQDPGEGRSGKGLEGGVDTGAVEPGKTGSSQPNAG